MFRSPQIRSHVIGRALYQLSGCIISPLFPIPKRINVNSNNQREQLKEDTVYQIQSHNYEDRILYY